MKEINWKEVGKDSLFVGLNCLAALIVIALIVWALTSYLRGYTEHGVEVSVPDLVTDHLTITEAEEILKADQLQLVILDSAYVDNVPFGTIVKQDPSPYSSVKHGRDIYVTINASGRRQVAMYNWHDKGYRHVENRLRSLGLVVDPEYDYEPSEFRDLVLDVRTEEGESVEPDQMIAVGTRVRLVVGFGLGTEEVTVPNLIGMKEADAKDLLRYSLLTVSTVYDEIEGEEESEEEITWFVYRQTPNADEKLVEGQEVKIFLSPDLEKAATDQGDEEEGNWF